MLCFSKDVSLLSLYGGNDNDFEPVLDSYSADITCLNANKLLFIYIPSLNTIPDDLVTFCL